MADGVVSSTPRSAPQSPSAWRLSRAKSITLDRPRIVAILNLTPDSFSDGGSYPTPAHAVEAAHRLVTEGADAIDVGGESTRPGARRIDDPEQVRRLVPFLHALRRSGGTAQDIPVTVDTTRGAVARAALDAGADAINDISAGLDDPGMLPLAGERGVGIVLMHRLQPPERDSYSDRYDKPPSYGDVVADVRDFLRTRAETALAAEIGRDAIVLDPGLGFGKSVEQNLELIRRTAEIRAVGYPVMSGASRKSFVGRVSLGRDSTPAERLSGTLALSVAHLFAGAMIFRVHDVRPHAEALSAAWGVRGART